MKVIYIFICAIMMISCSKSPEEELGRLMLKDYPNTNNLYSYFIVIPGGGCDGCISGVEQFVKENYARRSVIFFFTNIESEKVLRFKMGTEILTSKNIVIDKDGKYSLPNKYKNSIYPIVYKLKGNRVSQVSFISPNGDDVMAKLYNEFQNNPEFSIDINKYIEGEAALPVKLSDITDSIMYIPLKTPKGLPVSLVQSVRISPHYIFYLDNNQQLFMFDRNGDFIRMIGKRGAAPDEYISLSGFEVDDSESFVYLHDFQRNRILAYDMKGVLVKKLPLSRQLLNLTSFYNDQFIGFVPKFYSNGQEAFYMIDYNGEIKDSIHLEKKTKSLDKSSTDLFKMATLDFNKYLLFTLPFVNSTYKLSPTGHKTKYFEIKQGKYQLPERIGSNVKLYNENLTKYIFELNTRTSSSKVFIDFFYNMENYRLIYDINQNRLFEVSRGKYRKGIYNDIDGGISVWPAMIKNDTIISIIDPSAIENLETVNESTKRLYQSFMLYDNPVIQIVGIKKKLKVR